MRRTIAILIFSTLWVLLPQTGLANEVKVRLSIEPSILRRGDVPRFKVVVTATADAVRLLRFDRRGDLRDNYAVITIKEGTNTVELPVAISDPGPTDANDYINLKRGQEFRFEHNGEPMDLRQLQPARYSATMRLHTDWRTEPALSNSVFFEVRK